MTILKSIRIIALILAGTGLVLPLHGFAQTLEPLPNPFGSSLGAGHQFEMIEAPGQAPAGPVQDVSLDDKGGLSGQVLDTDGLAIAGAPVTIQQNGKVVHSCTTNQSGNFQAQGLRGGVYEVSTPTSCQSCRCWPRHAAPPIARPGLRLQGLLGSPLVTIAVAAGAIAIPLALSDDEDDAS